MSRSRVRRAEELGIVPQRLGRALVADPVAFDHPRNPLDSVSEVLDTLRAGEITGRAVLVP